MVKRIAQKYLPDDELHIDDICKYLGMGKNKVLGLLQKRNIIGSKMGRNRWTALFKNVEEFKRTLLEGGIVQRDLPLK
jgi:hypothetical protein